MNNLRVLFNEHIEQDFDIHFIHDEHEFNDLLSCKLNKNTPKRKIGVLG